MVYPWFELGSIHFIVNKKWINKVYKLGKVDDRIPVDPGAQNKTETKPGYKPRKMVLKLELDSRLDLKIVETF